MGIGPVGATASSAAAAAAASSSSIPPPKDSEQLVFERRLCHDVEGVAVRKINQNGKSAIRHVRCLPVDELGNGDGLTANRSCSSKSASVVSLGGFTSGSAGGGGSANATAPPTRPGNLPRRGSGSGGGAAGAGGGPLCCGGAP